MSSIKDRQRAAARARLEKEMAERAEAARKRRQRQAVIGSALAVVVIAGVAVWLVSSMGSDDDKDPAASAPPAGTVACAWIPEGEGEAGSNGGKVVNVGTPPANVPNVGNATMTINTTLGKIEVAVDRSKAPCTAGAIEFLASKEFWQDTKCHRLTTEGIKVLQCGDPSAKGKGYRQTDGSGGPGFRYAEENLPTGQQPAYPKGTLAMAKTQSPSSTGSQFFITFDDVQLEPQYTVVGKVTSGLDIVEKVGKAGSNNASGNPGDGNPKTEIGIKSIQLAAA